MKTTGSIWVSSIAVLIFCSVFLWSTSTGALKGTIKDAKTGEVLSGAKITLVYSPSEALKYKLQTDKKGKFYKSGLRIGVYRATFEKDGYIPVGASIRVKLAATVSVEIELEPLREIDIASENFIGKGKKQLDNGKYVEAIEIFTDAISKDSSNPVYHYYRAVAFERNGNTEKAMEDYQRAVELKSDFTLPLSRLGVISAKKGDFERAIEFYDNAVDLGFKDSETFYNYGVCLVNTGRIPKAKSVLERLLILDPEYSDAYYQLGIISIGLGETEKAKELLRKFIEMDPENKNASIAKEILKSLK